MLKQLSILPSIEIKFEFLQEIFHKKEDEEFEEILNYFSEKGWLYSFDNRYKLSQTIKEYILANYLPSFEEIEKIVDFFYNSKAKYLKSNLFYMESINSILKRIGKMDEFYNDNISDASCDLCKTKLDDEDFFIDGQIKNSGGKWGNVCLNCFEEHGIQIGKGIGQLYKKNDNHKWLLFAGLEINRKEAKRKTFDTTMKEISKQDVFETQIDGEFNGWEGETIVKLMNGELWQQSEYYYHYHYAYMPTVSIIENITGYKMKVDGIDKEVGVIKLSSLSSFDNTHSDVIESQIDGDFNGWEGETIFKLMNGQIWKQSSYSYHYSYKFMPKVIIYKSDYGYKMKVDGDSETVDVEQIK